MGDQVHPFIFFSCRKKLVEEAFHLAGRVIGDQK